MAYTKGYPYTVSRITVAAWDFTAEAYGTPASFNSAQGINVDPQLDTDMLKNYGAMERALSILTHYEGAVVRAGIDAAVQMIVEGITSSLSGSTRQVLGMAGGVNAPYFGLIAHLPMDDGYVMLWGHPLCMAASQMAIEIEQNKFALPEFKYNALRLRIANGNTFPIAKPIVYASDPGAITDFKGFFAIA